MPQLKVLNFAISLDGFEAGPDQSLENPLGVRGPELMESFFHTRAWRTLHGQDGGETGVDIRLGGGVATIRQYLQAGLIDEMHLAVRPVLLGSGEHLFKDLDLPALGYECTTFQAGERATHMFLNRRH